MLHTCRYSCRPNGHNPLTSLGRIPTALFCGEGYHRQGPGDERVFFLLKAKYPVIARDLGVATGGLIVKQGGTV